MAPHVSLCVREPAPLPRPLGPLTVTLVLFGPPAAASTGPRCYPATAGLAAWTLAGPHSGGVILSLKHQVWLTKLWRELALYFFLGEMPVVSTQRRSAWQYLLDLPMFGPLPQHVHWWELTLYRASASLRASVSVVNSTVYRDKRQDNPCYQ